MNTATTVRFSALILTSILLIGCQHTTYPDTGTSQNTDSTTTLPTTPMTAQQVTFRAIPLDYELPKQVSDICVGEPAEDQIACPEIEVELAEIQPQWIEDVINLYITNDNNPQRIKYKRDLDYHAMLQLEDASSHGYMFQTSPKQERTHNNVAQFSISQYMYMGGAHGLPFTEYHLFDMTLQSEIGLSDVFENYHDDVYHFAQDAYFDYLASQDVVSDEQRESYMEIWPFEMTENFYFGDTGIVLVYQPYELGSYAQGFIELVVPYTKIQEIMRPEYVPK